MAGIASVIGQVAGGAAGAAAGPWAIATQAVSEVAKPLLDLIPDPKAKQAAQQHIADQQYALAMAQIDAQNKEIAAASQNIAADPHMSWVRAFFCFSMSLVYVWNYGLCGLIGRQPFVFPNQLHWMFAALMLGLIGIPSVLDTFKSIMSMPGNSSASFMGMNITNKP